MKKQNIFYKYILALLFTSVLFITACSDVFNNSEKGDKATINISLEQSESRTVIPVYDFESFTDFKLTGKKSNNTETLVQCSTYADLESADIQIDSGTWEFFLTAKKGNEEFSGTVTENVVAGETVTLAFTLSHTQKGTKGSVNLIVRYPVSDEIENVVYRFQKMSESLLAPTIISGDALNTGRITITNTNLDIGEYLLDCVFYSEEYDANNPNDNKLGSYSEIIVVESGLETTLDISLTYLLNPNDGVFDGIVTNTASAYTYSTEGAYPLFIHTLETVPSTLTTGRPSASSDGILTVTPRSDGLLIQIDFTKTNASKTWIHNTVIVKDITDVGTFKYPIEVEGFSIHENEDGEAVSTEFLFPYTKSGREYRVYIIHMNKNWGEWATTESNAVQVTATGGYGILDTSAQDAFYVGTSDTHKLFLKHLTFQNPGLNSSNSWLKAVFRIGTRDYYDGNLDTSYGLDLEGDVLDFTSEDIINFIKDKDQFYIELKYRESCNDQEQNLVFSQVVYENKDKWFSDMSGSQLAVKLPAIKIYSTSNEGDLSFVSEPIAHHVKDAQRSWNDLSNVNTPDPWYEDCTVTAIDENGTTTSVSNSTASVKVRGNWTTNYDKKSLRIKFAEKANMLGLNNGKTFKNWVLLASWKDASLLRDAVGLKMFKALFPEYYVSDCKLVDVYINDVYWGVYLLAEQQEPKKNRINITEAEKDSTNTDIGYLIEYDSYYTSEASEEVFEIDYRGEIKGYNGTALVDPQAGYTIKSDVYSTDQRDFIAGYMNKLWKLCYDAVYNKKYYTFNGEYDLVEYVPAGDTDDDKCKNCISEVIDVKSLADMYIFNELVCDPDIYLTSFFMDIDFASGKDHKLRFEAPWDFDSTMGNKRHIANAQGMFAGKVQQNVNYDAATEGYANPWMVIFIKQGWFQSLVKSEWAARNPNAAKTTVCNFIDNSVTNYGTRLEFNRTRWGDPHENDELCPASKTAAEASQAASATYLKNWLTDRFTAVDTLISSLSTN